MGDEDLRNLMEILEVMGDQDDISIGIFRCSPEELLSVTEDALAMRAARAFIADLMKR